MRCAAPARCNLAACGKPLPTPPRPLSPQPPPHPYQLRSAFLSRFPVRINVAKFTFTCSTPAVDMRAKEMLVFKLSAGSDDDERVMLALLSELDKAYTAKFEGQLEHARADMLSSSMTFQVVADEIREGQVAYQKRWEKETRGMREHLSINQKRLFLLEQEKNQLQQTASTSESLTGVLRDRVSGLATENAALKERLALVEAQLQAQAEAMSAVFERLALGGGIGVGGGGSGVGGGGGSGGGSGGGGVGGVGGGVGGVSAETQTEADETTKHWQQQLIAVSDWLQTGAALLQQPEPAAEPAADSAATPAPAAAADPAAAAAPASAAEGQPVVMVGRATINGRPMVGRGGARGAGRGGGASRG
jgi:hypothetical protein